MDFFISPAFAQSGATSSAGGMIPTLVMIGLFFVFMYFMIIRPQMKRSKEHKSLLASLDKGNEVITSGGMAGRIRKVGENLLVIEVADGVEIRVQKNAITSVVPKGTLDSL